MADYKFPDDLLKIQRDFFEIEERIKGAEGEEFLEAFAAQQALTLAKLRHTFWSEVPAGQRYQADMALRKAAREGWGY